MSLLYLSYVFTLYEVNFKLTLYIFFLPPFHPSPPFLHIYFYLVLSIVFCLVSLHLSFCWNLPLSLAILHLTSLTNFFSFAELFPSLLTSSNVFLFFQLPSISLLLSLCAPPTASLRRPSLACSFAQARLQRLWPRSWQSRPKGFCVLAMCHPQSGPWPS